MSILKGKRLALIIGTIMLVPVVVASVVFARRQGESREWANGVASEATVTYEVSMQLWLEYGFKRADDVEKLVLLPLREARLDPEPAAYIVYGTLTVRYDGGRSETFTLFFPFGHFRYEDKYYIADFGELAAEISKLLKLNVRRLETSVR